MLLSPQVAVRVVDAAYDLESPPAPWLGGLLESGDEILNQGLGCAAVAIAGRTRSGEPLVSRIVTHQDGSDRLALLLARASRSVHLNGVVTEAGQVTSEVRTLSGLRSDDLRLYQAVRRHVGCDDALCLLAVDSELHGVLLITPTRKRISITAKAQKRWKTLASHIGAADRLRRALGRSNRERLIPVTALPQVLSVDKELETRTSVPSGRSLRDAAIRRDAERCGHADHTTHALEVLRGLVDGELSMIDWFSTNGRCFTLVRANDPSLRDPRALTTEEKQVVLRTAGGESRKLVAYNIGVDRSRVSRLLRSAMRKLGVKNQSELVMKVRCLERHELLHER